MINKYNSHRIQGQTTASMSNCQYKTKFRRKVDEKSIDSKKHYLATANTLILRTQEAKSPTDSRSYYHYNNLNKLASKSKEKMVGSRIKIVNSPEPSNHQSFFINTILNDLDGEEIQREKNVDYWRKIAFQYQRQIFLLEKKNTDLQKDNEKIQLQLKMSESSKQEEVKNLKMKNEHELAVKANKSSSNQQEYLLANYSKKIIILQKQLQKKSQMIEELESKIRKQCVELKRYEKNDELLVKLQQKVKKLTYELSSQERLVQTNSYANPSHEDQYFDDLRKKYKNTMNHKYEKDHEYLE